MFKCYNFQSTFLYMFSLSLSLSLSLHGRWSSMLLTNWEFLQLRLNRDGFIIGTEYLSDLVEKEHADHKHGNILVHSTPMF